MIKSMTGFASSKGEHAPFSWSWELRSVNAKGLDLRLRVPDWLDGLEAALRPMLAKSVARGNITLSLRLSRNEEGAALSLNHDVLTATLEALHEIEVEAMARGITFAPSKASDLLSVRGILEAGAGEEDQAPLVAQLKSEFEALVQAFVQMRATEGAALAELLDGQLTRIAELTTQAASVAEARKEAMADTLKANLAKILENTDGADPDRVAQELAILTVKADVTEEIDRLGAHIKAARDLVAKGGAVGRKLDFLMQEFNREANTLCSKSQNTDLTAIGLDLKAVIDQMREQVQNVE
ncbi:YicC/YloC family endoribonuclease [Ruegeria sp. 2205SS24-7]|uniref:YicC/YloC family endoribonuclease n=1 Tax=Ruegeria discodermiae TaxID=3064389 RepID=UPI002740E298|nr:YicC/YloC family endoribonuclease [Ruegeria sp. 2205SS24-7]MDP5216213.1 YicC/YloC family endoribonuclease [Ruegeria sp. 2205SS24-7]